VRQSRRTPIPLGPRRGACGARRVLRTAAFSEPITFRNLSDQNERIGQMITRRHILTTALLLATVTASPVRAEDKPGEIRIGTQKGGFFPAVRQRHTLEDAFKPLGIEIKWVDFQFGPPLLE